MGLGLVGDGTIFSEGVSQATVELLLLLQFICCFCSFYYMLPIFTTLFFYLLDKNVGVIISQNRCSAGHVFLPPP
jgi:hypothetical protein